MSQDLEVITEPGAVDRRRFLRTAAVAAWASPLIISMAATRAGAATCIPHGSSCCACGGMRCCPTSEDVAAMRDRVDSGCCCSPDDLDTCPGTCTATDAECENGVTACFLPQNATGNCDSVPTNTVSKKNGPSHKVRKFR